MTVPFVAPKSCYRHAMLNTLLLAGLAASLAGPAQAQAQEDSVTAALRTRLAAAPAAVQGGPLAARTLIGSFYAKRVYRPAWDDADAEALGQALASVEQDGLRARDYHGPLLHRLDSLAAVRPTAALLADRDVLRTDAFLRLAFHLRYGKVQQETLQPTWIRSAMLGTQPALAALAEAADSGSVLAVLEVQRPADPRYTGLRAALASYRQIAAGGGWGEIPKGPPLKLGMADARVPALRQRLTLTGDYAGLPDSSTVFDSALVEGTKHYQRRHGLTEDGALGEGTRRSLNVPVSRRIDQIRVNLDRARALFREVDSAFMVVNVPQFQLWEYDRGEPVWTSKVQVGMADRKTPLFRARMAALVFNPTWTVPPTILGEDVIPGMRKNPNYLEKKGLAVYDKKGNPVDDSVIDWKAASRDSFPYVLRQDAGDDNALGKVKFLIPNPWAIYMHDTPHRAAFKQAVRATSSGCIRVQLPLELATRALARSDSTWTQARIDSVLASGETKTVGLKRGLPVRIEYRTASVERDGLVYLLPDIYNRDARTLQALDAPYGKPLPPLPPDKPAKPVKPAAAPAGPAAPAAAPQAPPPAAQPS